MSLLRTRIAELAEQHGSLAAAARVLMVDKAYLWRLQQGEKDDPGDDLLRRLKLRRVVRYERTDVAFTDLVQELRETADRITARTNSTLDGLLSAAADEIERLAAHGAGSADNASPRSNEQTSAVGAPRGR